MKQFLRTRQELADMAGVSLAAVSKWKLEPRGSRGKAILYDLRDAWSHRFRSQGGGNGKLNLIQEQAKLTKRRREKLQLEVDEMRKRLTTADSVTTLWEKKASTAREECLQIPRRCGRLARRSHNDAEAEQAIKDAVYETLDVLAAGGKHE